MTSKLAKGSGQSLSFSSEHFDQEKYTAVAVSANLMDLRLKSQRYSMKAEAVVLSDSLPDGYNFYYSGELDFAQYIREDGHIVGSYKWAASVKKKRRQILTHSAEFVLMYGNLSDMDEEYCMLYFKKLSRFTTYPYFRALFAANVMNSRIVLPPLPSLKDRMD